MTEAEEFTENLSKAILDDDAHEVHRSLSQYMNSYLELKIDELDEDVSFTVPDNEGTDLETQISGTIEKAAVSFGANPDIVYEQGTMVIGFDKKRALEHFLDWVDTECDYVDDYEVEAFRTDALDQVEELDFNELSDDDPWTFEVSIYLSPEIVSFYDDYELDEALKRVFKVDARGGKRVKMKCGKGFKWNAERHACEKITGAELAMKRKAIKKAVRTKKSMGNAFKVRMVRKMKKAKKFRKGYGLK